jgi:hypothetical protein
MVQAIPPSTPKSLEAAFYPSLQNPAAAICTEAWQKIHAATLKQTGNVLAGAGNWSLKARSSNNNP